MSVEKELEEAQKKVKELEAKISRQGWDSLVAYLQENGYEESFPGTEDHNFSKDLGNDLHSVVQIGDECCHGYFDAESESEYCVTEYFCKESQEALIHAIINNTPPRKYKMTLITTGEGYFESEHQAKESFEGMRRYYDSTFEISVIQ